MMYSEFYSPAQRAGHSRFWHLPGWSVKIVLLLCLSVAGVQAREGISDAAVAELAGRAMSEFNMAIMILKT